MFQLGENVSEAIRAATKTLHILPTQAAAMVNLGIGYSREGQFVKSIYNFEQALKLRADDGKTLGYQAVTLADWSRGFYEQNSAREIQLQAVKLLDRAFRLDFSPPALLHTRASLAIEMEVVYIMGHIIFVCDFILFASSCPFFMPSAFFTVYNLFIGF